MNVLLKNGVSILLGLLMMIFGLNKFLGFIQVEPPADQTAQVFLGTMFTSYLFWLVGIIEVVAGILFIIPKLRLIGWIVLLPVMINIVAFHIAHDFIGNGIWLLPTVLFCVVAYAHREKLSNSFKALSI